MALSRIPTCFATCSIGNRPEHTLRRRLDAIALAGFSSIELAFPDLVAFATQHLQRQVAEDDYDALCIAGELVAILCKERGLRILVLQPFANFEGWPQGSEKRRKAFDKAKGWIRVMKALKTDMLQVGSSDSPDIVTSSDYIASDLTELAALLAEHKFYLAYENWCWSTHAPSWKHVWHIVQKVNLPNVGLCLDTFQIAGSEWADPTTRSGLIEDVPKETLQKEFMRGLEQLSTTIPKEKIYFLQISDAYKPTKPLSKEVDENGLKPRGRWSHDYRPRPYDGGYLPVVDVTKAVLKTGFRGHFSMEVFDNGPDGSGKEYDLNEFAMLAMESHKRLLEDCSEL